MYCICALSKYYAYYGSHLNELRLINVTFGELLYHAPAMMIAYEFHTNQISFDDFIHVFSEE